MQCVISYVTAMIINMNLFIFSEIKNSVGFGIHLDGVHLLDHSTRVSVVGLLDSHDSHAILHEASAWCWYQGG